MNLEPIDTSTTAGKARVMQLAAEGRTVAIRYVCPRSEWIERNESRVTWNWDRLDYAIIAEPVGPDEVWVTVSEGDPIDVYKDETTAACSTSWEVVRYVRAD